MTEALRAATPADADAIARLHIASWRAAYRAELPASFLEQQDPVERTRLWLRRLAQPDLRVMLLDRDGRLLAFCAFGPTSDDDAAGPGIWEILNLHVAPELRRGGLGSRLFDETVRQARVAGAAGLTLWVVDSNVPARRFYERHGMSPDGGRNVHTIAPGAALTEVRYVMALG